MRKFSKILLIIFIIIFSISASSFAMDELDEVNVVEENIEENKETREEENKEVIEEEIEDKVVEKIEEVYDSENIEAEKIYEMVKINNIWRMSENGKVNYNYKGIGTNENGMWLFENGQVTFKFSGIYKDSNNVSYYIENSKVKTELNEVIKIKDVWTYVKDGIVRYDYTGIANNKNGSWFIEKGIVTFQYDGNYVLDNNSYIIEKSSVRAIVKKDTNAVVKIDSVWKMVRNGKIDYSYNGIGKNEKGSWIVKNGIVDFHFSGIYTNEKGEKYIVQNSKIQEDINSVVKTNGIWTYVNKGKLDYSYTGIASNDNGKWYVKNGIVNFSYNDTYYEGNKAYIIENSNVKVEVGRYTSEVAKINGVWKMFVNGKIDYSYNGIGENEKGSWIVKNGIVSFDFSGIYKDSNNNKYVVENSKIKKELTKVMKISNVWTYVNQGKLDYDFTGIAENENGMWYVKKGIVDFKYTDTYFVGEKAYLIENSNVIAVVNKDMAEVAKINGVWRLVDKGVIDYQYSGIGTNSKGTWLLENGQVTFSYTGWYEDENKDLYLVENSKIQDEKILVAKLKDKWVSVKDGKVNYEYTGIASNTNGTWYVEDGIVSFDFKGTIFEDSKAYIIENSKVFATVTKTTTKLMKINDIWRMVVNGEVDYKFEGVASNSNGDWVLEKGKVTFSYNGKYTDKHGNIYNVKNSEIREILYNVKYPGAMCIEEPSPNIKYTAGALMVSGWSLSTAENEVIKFYLDGKYAATAQKKIRDDVFNTYSKNEYGGKSKNPKPGYFYNINTSNLNRGIHTMKVVVYTSDGKNVIQSRETTFTISYLMKRAGIDVSKHQGHINWEAVKNSGIEFAILRVGYYLESSGTVVKDEYFDEYYNECKRLGIAVGGYFYSYAFNAAEAQREANACLSIISGKGFEMPIFLDVEDNILKKAVSNGRTNVAELTNASIAFCDIMNNNGYRGGVYASKSFFKEYLNAPLLERYNIWLAHYTTSTDYDGKYDLWQYSSTGLLSGINGYVDMDWCFTRYY